MFILNPTLQMESNGNNFVIEDIFVRLTFEADSAELCRQVLPKIERCHNVNELAKLSDYSNATVQKFISLMEEDGLLLNLSDLSDLTENMLINKIRLAALFWNKQLMHQTFPTRLFNGEATREEVLGWGIEFYFFIRAANEYMARGSSRIDGPTAALSSLWQHYAEEALHEGIFLEGLAGCGIDKKDISKRPPLASTLALLNHLYESSEKGVLEYAALFAVMQPLTKPPTDLDVIAHYDFLRDSYPFAKSLFDAFQKHDNIDASLGHAKLALEPLLESTGQLGEHAVASIFSTIEDTANSFIIFFEGIPQYYKKPRSVSYRQVPNASAAVLNC